MGETKRSETDKADAELQAFKKAAKRVISVPKKEIERREREWRDNRNTPKSLS
jgi:hypothetical protein